MPDDFGLTEVQITALVDGGAYKMTVNSTTMMDEIMPGNRACGTLSEKQY